MPNAFMKYLTTMGLAQAAPRLVSAAEDFKRVTRKNIGKVYQVPHLTSSSIERYGG